MARFVEKVIIAIITIRAPMHASPPPESAPLGGGGCKKKMLKKKDNKKDRIENRIERDNKCVRERYGDRFRHKETELKRDKETETDIQRY